MIDTNDPCFVFGLNLDSEGGAVNLESVETDCAWMHIDYSHSSTADFLASLGLQERVVLSLIQPDTRPRTVKSKEGTLVIIRGINLNPGADPEDMISLRMWIETNRLVTVRQRKMLSIQDIKSDLLKGAGPDSIPDLVISIIGKVADRISDYVNGVEDQLVLLEESVQSVYSSSTRSQISAVRREIAGVRRYLAPQRDALDKLYTHYVASMPEACAYRLREQMDRTTRYLEDLDLIRERTLVLQEEVMNISMEQQNSRMYALSIVALVFLPVTFVTGVFGMNVGGLPGLENQAAFMTVVGTMLFISIAVITVLKVKRWF
ncbi:MAG: zinc transporter [Candidatus Azotimanducaceae bacterium]|jgi:zinc transporter